MTEAKKDDTEIVRDARFYWKRPEYPVRLAAGMNGRIMNCAPGGARLANKVFPVPRLIPRPSNPREPLAAGIGRGKFYFANLWADVMRCVRAAEAGDDKRYDDSLARAQKTLAYLRAAGRPEAYEEGLLLLSGLFYARTDQKLAAFAKNLNKMVSVIIPHTLNPI